MILQALVDYYNRKASDPDGGVAPEGFEHKEIPFIIVIDQFGKIVQIEDTRRQEGGRVRAKAFLVPRSEKRTSGVKANLLWDNAEYIFGMPIRSKSTRVIEQHNAFIARITDLGLENDQGIRALLSFLSTSPADQLEKCQLAIEIKVINPFMAFRLNEDSGLINERTAVIAKIASTPLMGRLGRCLVSGEVDLVSKLQPSIKGVRNTNTSGGDIVSFNMPAFNSFGKAQGDNAPIGTKSTFAYTTALNHLLRKGSPQKMFVGDATAVFWADKSSQLEDKFAALFDEPPKDNPDQLIDAVRALYNSINIGAMPVEDKEANFFVLGLAPNMARISVRFWCVGSVAEFSKKIVQHFIDLELVCGPNQRRHLSIFRLLCSTAVHGDSKNISPRLGGEWMRCILAGLPYPDSLYQAVLRRIHVERDVSYPRAAIIKAYLNRKNKFINQFEKEMTVSLDKENRNPGYLLGRLFAVLEKVQEEANGDMNATIRDRYYSAASGAPASVMPILMRSKNHHLSKLQSVGKRIYFERMLSDVIGEVSDFPAQLSLHDQGRFAIGYYHQRQAFFTKSEKIGD